ncbi:bifunctional diguanylate cyclase/phosphodiesterase [Rummeliibacillus sp. POC4]|uniref:putative bifunctional diguanylate cyclase/phosphodiesterase n=1 Tax=Rummeliibacillus sp. POC4 TaxID=2305899 RepID=UPI000E665090|nr:GGDEF domain-containing phosphodiesterase [Rummeliibacillus sp. POC4]RIJ67980.1 phosphodiesterase [Rummeliibacillus sp. POC4]
MEEKYSGFYLFLNLVLIVLFGVSLFTIKLTTFNIVIFSIVLIVQVGLAAYIKFLHQDIMKKLVDTEKNLMVSEREIKHKTYFDEITKLPNERYLLDKIEENLHVNPYDKAVLVFEIDRLASIKSSLGSVYSDCLLRKVAQRLQDQLSDQLIIGKLRDDQFVILIDHYESRDDILKFCKQLQKIMETPFEIQYFSLNNSLNIGISFYPKDAESELDLIKFAQIAAYEARNTQEHILFYETSMSDVRTERVTLENDLFNALKNNELFLEYQPQVDTMTGEIISMEALVRWRHPKRGLVSPGEFIPVAEESGLINPIGKWVLETACYQTKKLQDKIDRPIQIAVNLSLCQLFQGDFVQTVQQILEKTELSPQSLQLELTESMTMNTDHLTPILHDLKSLGVSLAVDDFGTGYSSLSYLRDLPIDCLKIDCSFVKNIQQDTSNEPIVDMIISMAKHLNLKVVAEGVEEITQFNYLMKSKCDFIQGYLFSRPISIEQIFDTLCNLQHIAKEMIQSLQEDLTHEAVRKSL